MIAGVAAVIQGGSNLINYGTVDSKAIQTIEAKRQTDTILSRLRQQRAIQVPVDKFACSNPGDYYCVERIEFQNGKIVVYFESDTGRGRYDESCITWYEGGIYKKQLADEKKIQLLGGNHVKGYMSFSDSTIKPNYNYYFQFGCQTYHSLTLLWLSGL